MKQRYRVFLRPWGVYYCEDLTTKKQETLKTRDKDEAYRIVAARNENEEAPAFSLHLARVYWKAGDPTGATRTWQDVMDEIPKLKTGETHHRWLTAIKDTALDTIRKVVVLETSADHFLKVLENGSVSTNIYLRRIHNFALDMNWLPWPVLPKKRWPKIQFKKKRAITWDEHQKIVAAERNPERRTFYQLAWQLGASQSDLAFLEATDINWQERVIAFHRKKTGTLVLQSFDDDTAALPGRPSR
jgi:integrase